MEQFKIHLPVSSYVSNDFGEFCVQLGNCYFPGKNWTDFGEKVIFSWRDHLTKWFSERNNKVSCRFMDGNYRIDIEQTQEKNSLLVTFIKDSENIDKIEYLGKVNSNQFFQEILQTIELIQEECKRNNNYEAVKRIEVGIQKFQKAKLTYFSKLD